MRENIVNPEEIPNVRTILNGQTGKLKWNELEEHFARGIVIHIAIGLDLVEVAACIVEDNAAAIQQWQDSGSINNVTESQASTWSDTNAEFWAVVTPPWVLIQEIPHQSS